MKAPMSEKVKRFLSDMNRAYTLYERLEAGETKFTIDGWKIKVIKFVTVVNGGQKETPPKRGFISWLLSLLR
jgi:hypothetical protein